MSRRILRGFSRDEFVSCRERAGFPSRADLARAADISVGAVYAWETGSATPQVDTLLKVAAVMGVSISDLVVVAENDRHLGDLRVFAGLTQPQLAKAVGMSTTALGALERAEVARLRPDVAAKLAEALDRTVGEIEAAYERTRKRPPGVAS
ncbi:XRE family transcriptional regulator [Rhodococcus sp. Eu-32]|uniref:helix-turn-helix transcriptional regulator n=1 Tax=Rhodococcus sp. Eu-32 TaxID=1017319 RepID=UPI000DF345B7|nr:helix-turn-helix transcriptional regulator [Rhodococcus sp. Eu-32]RRQ26163.1 XRE family transcriptional regulator [Rhodococcus sp. Eu-32]